MASPTALQRFVKRALLSRMKADASVVALVPVTAIEADEEVRWPFIRIDAPRATPLKASCVRGATVRIDIHAFAGPRLVDGVEVQTGFDHASEIGAAIEAALADNRFALENGATCRVTLSDEQMLRDGLPNEFHWFCQANARVLSE